MIGALDNQTIDEDTSLTVELSANDIDSNDLTFSATNGDSDITVNGSTLTITPPANYNGSEAVTVTVSDGELSDSTTFTLTVNPVNDAPTVFGLIGPEDSTQITITPLDLEQELDVVFSWEPSLDVDNDDLSLSLIHISEPTRRYAIS